MDETIVEHIPVLSEALIEQVSLPQDGVMVDATIGHGGHSLLFGRRLSSKGTLAAFDVDAEAIGRARHKLGALACKVILIHSNFARVADELAARGITAVDFILADLGYSSGQLADSDVGLSFRSDMPLDMRIDKSLKTTAADIVNKADERTLADLIYEYGEDRASRRIARTIARQRQVQPITTTGELASLVCRALGRSSKSPRHRKHPARRTFQALRIAVNQELDNLDRLLTSAPALLRPGGHVAVISFHSLEDRRVKWNFKENQSRGIYRSVSKKPITATRAELDRNYRAHSAKLRIAEKI